MSDFERIQEDCNQLAFMLTEVTAERDAALAEVERLREELNGYRKLFNVNGEYDPPWKEPRPLPYSEASDE